MIEMVRSILTEVKEGVIKRFSGAGRLGESFTDRELFQHYGFTSRPLAGAEAIVLKRGNIIICVASDDRRYRIAVEDGEVCLYTDEGDFVHFKRNKLLHVSTGGKLLIDAADKVEINTAQVKVNASGSVEVNTPEAVVNAETKCQVNSPEVNLSGDRNGLNRMVDERLIDIFNSHTHPGDSGGTTGAPNQTLSTENTCTDKVRAS